VVETFIYMLDGFTLRMLASSVRISEYEIY
jgi:hypothetical protein